MLYALSLQGQLDQYGAYIGVAAFVGLALLSLLYFAQARELKRLRDWAGSAPERLHELEQRVIAEAEQARQSRAQTRTTAPARPEPAAPPAPPVSIAPPVPVRPPTSADPRKTGGPGPLGPPAIVDQATEPHQAVGMSDPGKLADPNSGRVGIPSQIPPHTDPPATPGNIAASKVAARDASSPPVRTGVADGISYLGGPERAEELEAVGEVETAEPKQRSATRAQPRPGLSTRRAASGVTNRPRAAAVRASTPAAVARTRSTKGGTRAPNNVVGRRRWLTLVTAIAAIGLIVVLATSLLGGDDSGTKASHHGRQAHHAVPPGSSQSPTEPAARKNTTVAVLNGTTVTGLASTTSERLNKAGFTPGSTGNNTDQQRAASIVLYEPAKRAQANDVARLLKITDVQQVDPETKALAGSNADVVVVVGADQAP